MIRTEGQYLCGKLVVAVSFVLGLSACGGGSGGGGGGGNGLLAEAAGCAYLLESPFNLSAAELNSGGCAYTDENGDTRFWEGTDGGFGPGFNDPDTAGDGADPVDSTPGDDADVVDNGPVNQPQSGLSFPEAQAFTSELADDGNGSVYANSVSSALLFGPVVGTDEQQNESLYKSVAFLTENIQAGIEIMHVMAYESGLSNSTFLTFHVRNTGFETQCFVRHGGVSVFDASGVLLSTADLSFVDGGVNRVSDSVYTRTCIAPNEIVLMDEFMAGVSFADIAGVTISDVTSTPIPDATNSLVVEPVSYTVSDGVISILVANRSAVDLNIFSAAIYVISNDGRPIYSGLELPRVDVSAGAEVEISFPNRFDGSASTIRVVLDYDPI